MTNIQRPTFDGIRRIVADVLELEPGEIADTANFAEAYNADSLQAIEMMSQIERQYRIRIPQEDLADMTTLRQVWNTVQRHAAVPTQ